MIKVLSVNDYFLPGFKAGGPIRTLQNLARITAGHVEFNFLTRDHDLGAERYDGICSNQWASYPHGHVFYATARMFGPPALARAMSTREVDILYLNSFFSPKGSIAIVARNWARSFGVPILLAPRGEFSLGALATKAGRKRVFLGLARMLGLYRTIWWHASTQEEKNDILRQFPDAGPRIFTAENPIEMANDAIPSVPKKEAGLARLVFISRIAPKKNLDGLLTILQGVRCPVALAIYGPTEDQGYWQQCKTMIAGLPPHITVEYRGELKPENVSRAFGKGDLFAFPTWGENFGHVIFEALRAGTPVLVSDQTPWQPDGTSAVTRLSLGAVDDWRAHIESIAQLTDAEQQARRAETQRYAWRHATSGKARIDNLRMFEEVARCSTIKVNE